MTRRVFVAAFAASMLLAADPPGLAQAGRSFTTNFTPEEFAARRARVYDAIGPEAIAESGAQILSDFVPRSIAAVEKVVAEPGLLQRYAKIT